ncbi:hypothetical protein LZ30DRAFT_5938 [Colletotrichum cereale]|nr:hypothetical protein LZ30DRAFT_5938 [Colletotrichum cereale]
MCRGKDEGGVRITTIPEPSKGRQSLRETERSLIGASETRGREGATCWLGTCTTLETRDIKRMFPLTLRGRVRIYTTGSACGLGGGRGRWSCCSSRLGQYILHCQRGRFSLSEFCTASKGRWDLIHSHGRSRRKASASGGSREGPPSHNRLGFSGFYCLRKNPFSFVLCGVRLLHCA